MSGKAGKARQGKARQRDKGKPSKYLYLSRCAMAEAEAGLYKAESSSS